MLCEWVSNAFRGRFGTPHRCVVYSRKAGQLGLQIHLARLLTGCPVSVDIVELFTRSGPGHPPNLRTPLLLFQASDSRGPCSMAHLGYTEDMIYSDSA